MAVAAALLDGEVLIDQFSEKRINSDDVWDLIDRIWCTRQPRGIIPTFASVLLARVEPPGLRHSTRSANDLAPIFFMAWRTFKHSQGQNQR
jgi:hypothetical protein